MKEKWFPARSTTRDSPSGANALREGLLLRAPSASRCARTSSEQKRRARATSAPPPASSQGERGAGFCRCGRPLRLRGFCPLERLAAWPASTPCRRCDCAAEPRWTFQASTDSSDAGVLPLAPQQLVPRLAAAQVALAAAPACAEESTAEALVQQACWPLQLAALADEA